MPTLTALLSNHRREVLDTASRYGVSRVRVLRDVLEDASASKEQIDLLIRPQPDRGPAVLTRLAESLNDILGVQVALIPENSLPPRDRAEALMRAIPL